MVEKKQASLIPKYYDEEFLLYTNGKTQDYAELVRFHEEIYATPIQYKVTYDEQTLFEAGDRVAGRIFITISRPNEPPREIELILIAECREGKIWRVWEVTYPDWSTLPAFAP